MGFWSRSEKKHKRSKPGQRWSGLRPNVETLESRDLLTGTWAPLANAFPGPLGGALTQILLSNGTVMVQADEGKPGQVSTTWFALTPDSNGSYINGTWSQLASMNVSRHFFPSNVLPDGRVIVVGGEYSLPFDFTNAVEIYDPVANKWTNRAAAPSPPTQAGFINPPPTARSQFGDDPTQVLPNANVLAGYLADPRTFMYNVATNTWTTNQTPGTGQKRRLDPWPAFRSPPTSP